RRSEQGNGGELRLGLQRAARPHRGNGPALPEGAREIFPDLIQSRWSEKGPGRSPGPFVFVCSFAGLLIVDRPRQPCGEFGENEQYTDRDELQRDKGKDPLVDRERRNRTGGDAAQVEKREAKGRRHEA